MGTCWCRVSSLRRKIFWYPAATAMSLWSFHQILLSSSMRVPNLDKSIRNLMESRQTHQSANAPLADESAKADHKSLFQRAMATFALGREDKMYCTNCGNEVEQVARFCSKCGREVAPA